MQTKPKVVLDIKAKNINPHSSIKKRLNLTLPTIKISLTKLAKISFIFSLILYLAFGFVLAPNHFYSVSAQSSVEERAELEKQLAELEAEIAQYEQTASEYRRQGNSLKSEIGSLDTKINSLNAQIKLITASLNKISLDINQTQSEILSTEQKLALSKKAITQTLQGVYEREQVSLVAILLKNPNLTDFFNDINDLMEIQNKLSSTIKEVTELKENLLIEKESLIVQKAEATDFQAFQARQKEQVAATKQEKDVLLKDTQGKESVYLQLVAQRKADAAKIRSRIFQLLGGGEMTFEQAYNFAKYAENATNVEASFLLAILDRESNLGRNVGRCSYQTAMAPGPPESSRDDITPFLAITAELGLNPETTLVSCANSDGAYGGAMGPAQFIPTTWIGYKNRIATITGSNPPSPWRNSDAFVGTALYLQDALKSCSTEYSGDTRIRCAAARYYSGGYYKSHMWSTYGTATLNRKLQFDDDIALLIEADAS